MSGSPTARKFRARFGQLSFLVVAFLGFCLSGEGAAYYNMFFIKSSGSTYTVIYNANGATSGSVPLDTAVYYSGATVTTKSNIGSLIRTAYSFAGWNTQADGSGSSYAAGVGSFTMGTTNVTLYAMWTLNCGAFGGTWVSVPGNAIYGTPDFCVQKYIPSGVNTSSATGAPRVSLDQPTARSACSALGTGYHLITNPEWMTVAANIANVGSNWSGGTVGSGELARGHSDSSPNSACAADADDSKGWVDGTGDCTGKVQGSFQFRERRTRTLSNGSVIWDIGGNVWQWVDAYNPNNKPQSINNWVQYNLLGNGTTDWPRSAFVPLNSAQSWWTNSWNSTQSIGQIYPGTNDSGGALLRGGSWYYAVDASAGVFAASLSADPSYTAATLAFRCAYQPTTYTVTYNANGATSGSVPTDTTAYAATQPVTTKTNSGTLARTGFSFAGWNTAADGSGTTYVPGQTLTMGSANVTLYALWMPTTITSCSGLAGGTWVTVPGNNIYGTSTFCVQKYLPTNLSGYPTSTTGSTATPWVSITQTNAKAKCSALGSGYHLMTNPEWMTIGANLANVGSNWSGGTVGSGQLVRGHSDNSPSQSCPADANDANAWVHTNCTGQTQGSLVFLERRTRTLSNGQVIWDIGGNLWQWIDIYNPNNKPQSINSFVQYNLLGNGTSDWPRSAFVPINSVQSWWSDSWNSDQAIGQIYPGTNGSGGAMTRGGSWDFTTSAGVFTAYQAIETSYTGTNASFRCAYSPTNYTVTYNGNGSTSGTVPTDTTAYMTTQPVTVAANSGTLARTGYTFAGWNTAANGSGTSYAVGSTLVMGTANVTLYAQWTLNCNSLSGGTWVTVPGDSIYGTPNFCVQKYLPSGTNTSSATGSPRVSLNVATAQSACSALGTGYHLITNPEWMTIAANIANVGSNWSSGTVGTGELTRGHSDNNPASLCAANATDANAWVDGSCTGSTQGAQQFNQRRTQNLSNGQVIWDMSGNIWAWVDYNNLSDKPTPATNTFYEQTAITGSTTTPRSHLVPIQSVQSWWRDTWNSTQSIGKINPGAQNVGGPMHRGGSFEMTTGAGIFSAAMEVPSGNYGNIGFRCAYHPTTYTVTYNGNGSTGGTVPTDSTAYAATQPVTVATAGTLVRSGFTFAGWNTAANGSGISYAAGSTLVMGSANVTLYAIWVTGTRLRSCSEILNAGLSTGNGTYTIDPDGSGGAGAAFTAYCDMTTSGGGWTMVAAQFEADPVVWNEGIQADYNPNLTTSKSFTLNTSQLPAHNALGVGQALIPTFITHFNYVYTTGNIAKTSLLGADGSNYWIHRNTGNFYDYHNPDNNLGGSSIWWDTLTVEGYSGAYTTGNDYTWSFARQATNTSWRGYGMKGSLEASTQSYAWTLWVRTAQYYSVTYNANGATSGSVPTDSGTYATGATVTTKANNNTLARTGYSFAGWNTATDGSGTTYAAGTGAFTMGSANVTLYARWVPSLNCSGLAGGTWVSVPGDGVYGTSDFCVQKYLPSNVSSVATSQTGTTPWAFISQTSAKTTCSALGTGYHLITNPEWMTIAANSANVASNWSGGTVGSGALNRGHSDGTPNNALAAAADSDPCNGTGQTCSDTTWNDQRRTRTLSNGSVIWDFGGNVWLWVDYNNASDKPNPQNAWVEYPSITGSTTTPKSHLVPVNSVQSWWNNSWNSNQGLGRIYPGTNGSGGALYRGADWADGAGAGPFAAGLDIGPSITDASVGFRCTYSPTTSSTVTYAVTYDANGATSGTAPSSSAHGAGQTVTTAANNGILARTGFSFAGWSTAADGSGATYAAGSGTFTMGYTNVTLYARWVPSLNCSSLAGGTWVSVPGDGVYGTSDFCVQKYIPSGTNTSQTGVVPRVNLDQPTARSACTALGTGYHLITNPEWMTIAANIANVGSNWSGGTVGNGELARGHSDNSPSSACAADADDSKGWVQTNCTGQTQGALAFRERRTRTLSNGSVIWDIGGNVWQSIDYNNANDKPNPQNTWVQYPSITGSTTTPKSHLVPLNSVQSWWTDSWSSTQAIGQIYPGTNDSGGALLRGGPWHDDTSAGVFAAALNSGPSDTSTRLGFRCVYAPATTYTVTYDANGATSGTAPSPTAHGAGQTVTAKANSGTLAKTGYVFAGWNTAADGSGTNYTAGSGTFSMGSANVTLYARWTSCGESAANNCYTGTNAATLQSAGSAITPLGKSLTWNIGEGVWEESGAGTRVLSADGRDSWAYQLNGDGRSYSSSFLAKTNVAGRVCPTNVFVPGNLVATGKCIYFDGGSASQQRLDAPNNDSITVQTAGSYRLGAWDTNVGGNGTSASWYEGNIQTCANKGMRLPTLYETNASDPGGTTKPTDATPTGWGSGVAAISGTSWTASAVTDLNTRYRRWNTSGAPNTGTVDGTNFVRCVVPSEALYSITYDGNGNTSGTAPTNSNVYTTGATVTVASNTGSLARTGFTFTGWNTAANGSGTTYAAGSGSITLGAANVTLYALWSVNSISLTYDANGATSGTAPASANYSNNTTVTIAGNTGSLARTGYIFNGWNTAADGSGLSYVGGDSLTMGTANIALYARWIMIVVCGSSAADNCYSGTNAAAAQATGYANTPLGKSLIWNASESVWEENGGTRVLAADGTDAWQMGLSPDGRSFTSTAINKANVAGRACPGSVYINDNVMVASSRCLYYDAGNAAQRPDAAGTSQTTLGQIGFASWGANNTGNSIGASWYEGNVQTCAAKGMRLPTLYETTANNPGSWLPTDATPTWSGTRVPEVSGAESWTATAFTAGGNQFRTWLGTTSNAPNNTFSVAVRCVVPYAPLAYAIAYDANSATSGSVPTDSNSYATGQRLTLAANTGALARTGYTFAGWNTQANGGGINYAAGSGSYVFGTSNVTLYARWVQPLNCSGLAGGTWVSVPGDGVYGTSDFCVQKYVPSGTNTSQTGAVPRVNLDQPTARSACTALGTGYHLITNPEWMTIAANIANVGSNWSGGTVGSGELVRGHSDSNPNQACAADADDSKGWVETNCTSQTQGSLQFRERRTRTLSNGQVVWDIGGNIWQWVDLYNPNGKPTPADSLVEYPNLVAGSNWPLSAFVPRNSVQSWWSDSWNSTQSIGMLSTYGDAALHRGGAWSNGTAGGLFAASMYATPSSVYPGLSFRCAYTPSTTYTVAYDANGATSGTVPTTSAHGAGQTVTVAANSGTLAKSGGYVFAGWNTNAAGTGTNYTAGSGTFTMGSANVTLYAKWAPTYTITYSGNGATSGTAPTDSNAYITGQSATILGNTGALARTGYTFSGWNTLPNGAGTSYSSGGSLTMGSANIILYAVWVDPAISGMATTLNGWGWLYQCNTVPSGGYCSGPGSYTSSKTLPGLSSKQYNLNVTIFARMGSKIYSGGSNDGSYWQIGGSPGGNVNWEWYRLSITSPANTYYVNRGTVENLVVQTINYSKTLTVNGGTTITASAGASDLTIVPIGAFTYNGTYYANGGQYGTLTVNSTTPLNYLVYYDANGATSGTVPTDSTAYTSGTTVTARANSGTLTRTGYVFAGWNTAADGSGTNYTAGSGTFSMPAYDLTLFARWNPTYTVTYSSNGSTSGTAPTDNNAYTNGSTVTVASNSGTLVRTGYTFAGWNTAADGSGLSYVGGDSLTMGSANVTLFAKWTTTQTFAHTGATQTFTVPAGVTSITVKAWGGGGGAGNTSYAYSGRGGGAGYSTGTLSVTPGESLTVIVGGGGTGATNGGASAAGGFGGGGIGYSGTWASGGGGGRSAIRRASTELLTAAGGGGGGGNNTGPSNGDGGAGGGSTGLDGVGTTINASGGGGTQSAGGIARCGLACGNAGSAFTGGNGNSNFGGGGGGGYYGGGGGAYATFEVGGGGGGSSYVPAGGSTTSGSGTTPGNNTDPQWSNYGRGGAAPGTSGDHGYVIITWTTS